MAIDFGSLGPEAQRQILRKLGQTTGKPKTNKYHAQKDARGSIKFDSKREARRYDELMAMLRAGQIRDLKLQPQFTLQESYITPEGERIRAIRYVADFSYEIDICGEDGRKARRTIVEDAKSRATATQLYRNKKKMMQEKYGIDVKEI